MKFEPLTAERLDRIFEDAMAELDNAFPPDEVDYQAKYMTIEERIRESAGREPMPWRFA